MARAVRLFSPAIRPPFLDLSWKICNTTEYRTMDPHQIIDSQFDRAVEIVQGLPKTGPIQTGYEEKLAMYGYVTNLPPI